MRRLASRRGFTLIELLVVILIILLVSAVALPVVLPAMSHRQVSEAARILQGSLVGAQNSALHNASPAGIRLLPDPAFPLTYTTINGVTQIDPTQPLAANRIIPIAAAPEYSEGRISVVLSGSPAQFTTVPQYPPINGGGFYPLSSVLMVQEVVVDGNGNLNEPTCWYWNIRVGDKLQINDSGLWYTVVGPMTVTPQQGNSELFVNTGAAGSGTGLVSQQGPGTGVTVNPEYLLLVNGLDDNVNGWLDEGFDGVDNNANGIVDDLGEWEQEAWPASIVANPPINQLYTIQRRPAPAPNSREISLPTNVVIDMTMLLGSLPPGPNGSAAQLWTFSERSQFPTGAINPYTGYVDILLYPNGTVVPTTIYSSPSSYGMGSAFFHFWLAERSDVVAAQFNNGAPQPLVANQHVYLPIGNIKQQLSAGTPFSGPTIQGEYRIVSLFTRTGQVTSNDNVEFDNPLNPANGTTYNPLFPFLATEQGTLGGR